MPDPLFIRVKEVFDETTDDIYYETLSGDEPFVPRIEGDSIVVTGSEGGEPYEEHDHYRYFSVAYAPCDEQGNLLSLPVKQSPMPFFTTYSSYEEAGLTDHVAFMNEIIAANDARVAEGMTPLISSADADAVDVLIASRNEATTSARAHPVADSDEMLDPEEVRNILTDCVLARERFLDELEEDEPEAANVMHSARKMGVPREQVQMLTMLLQRYCAYDVENISGVTVGASDVTSGVGQLVREIFENENAQKMPFEPMGGYTAEVTKHVNENGVAMLAVKDRHSLSVYAWPEDPSPELRVSNDNTAELSGENDNYSDDVPTL